MRREQVAAAYHAGYAAAGKPDSEEDYWLGYNAAKEMLRSLLGKVPEQQQLAVVHAWLLQTIEENDDRG